MRSAGRFVATLVREPLKLLTRYILREQIGPLIFALSSLTALLLLQQVAKQFGNLVGKGLGWGVIGEFFLALDPVHHRNDDADGRARGRALRVQPAHVRRTK